MAATRNPFPLSTKRGFWIMSNSDRHPSFAARIRVVLHHWQAQPDAGMDLPSALRLVAGVATRRGQTVAEQIQLSLHERVTAASAHTPTPADGMDTPYVGVPRRSEAPEPMCPWAVDID